MITAFTVVHKPTGKRYHGEAKTSWRKRYYSFDRGHSWHASKVAAFKAAETTGKLWEAK